ncbi:hypothetical protein [Pseudomonas koreensis]|jgi:hypothetical protein|uniref:hypothetical protein n=1 Tax=Pseudomonas koreensis TaxID=198620 RepID=UPI0032098F58
MSDHSASIHEMKRLLNQVFEDYVEAHLTEGESVAEPIFQRLNDLIANDLVPDDLKKETRKKIRSLGFKKEKNILELYDEELQKPSTALRETDLQLLPKDLPVLIELCNQVIAKEDTEAFEIIDSIVERLKKANTLDPIDPEKTIVRLTALQLTVLENLFEDEFRPGLEDRELWWHANDLGLRLKAGLKQLRGEITLELIDARQRKMKSEYGD